MSTPVPAGALAALRAQFFLAGALFATWGVHVPTVKAHYGLGEQALAIAMLAAGVGSVLTLLQAGRVLGSHAPRRVSPLAGALSAVAIAGLLAFHSYPALLAVLAVYGVFGALFDVSINDEAAELERRAGRPLMSGFHALFSLGGMAGAAAGSALAARGVAPQHHLWAAGALGVLVAVIAGRGMLRQQREPDTRPPLSLPRGVLAWMGLLAAMGLVAEGAMYDWSVLYLKQDVGAATAVAGLAYASFSAAMAAGRFAGDWVRARVPPVTLLRASGLLGALGMLLAVCVPVPAAVLAGFALVGLGFSNIVPLLFASAATVPGIAPAHGIAAVSSLGYLGMMAGPPLIGFIAQGRSLALGLVTVIVFALAVALFARRALPR